MSRHTIDAYLADVQKFTAFLEMRNLTLLPTAVRREVLEAFVQWVGELGAEESTQSRIISGLRAFYKYLMIEDIIDTDPTEMLESPRLRRKLPSVLSIQEIQDMAAQIDLSTDLGIRNRALLETLYACGLRVSELVDMRLTNLFFDLGFVKVLGKNNKERIVPIGEAAVKYIQQYLDFVRKNQENIANGHENFVFLNRRGKKLSRVMVFLLIKEFAEKAGIKKNISPHTFRHSFASHLVEGGADLKAVQDMLGHESITTTEVYTHLDTEYLKETIYLYHPRLKWKNI